MVYNNEVVLEEIESSVNPQKQKTEKKHNLVNHDEFYKTYILPDKKSEEWDKSISSLLVRPKQLAYVLHKNKAKLNEFETNALFFISSFGSADVQDKVKLMQLKNLKNLPEVSDINVDGNTLTITKEDGTILRSTILSKTFGWFNTDELLETSSRSKLSHHKAIMVAKRLPFESQVVTGRVAGLTTKSKYLHSWVEAIVDGKSVVIDYTMNSIMNKSGYYALRQASSISRIDSYDLKRDEELTAPLRESKQLSLKEYLIYRDSIISALESEEE